LSGFIPAQGCALQLERVSPFNLGMTNQTERLEHRLRLLRFHNADVKQLYRNLAAVAVENLNG
jgi:hypothetical protein